jgi:hypothetical protein
MSTSNYLKTGIIAAIAYCIPLLVFLNNNLGSNSWILYIGNFTFTVVVAIAATIINKQLHDETRFLKMLGSGVKLTFASIIISIPFMVAIFYLFGNQDIPKTTNTETSLSPLSMLFVNLIVVNAFTGSFASLLSTLVYNRYPKNSKGQDIT